MPGTSSPLDAVELFTAAFINVLLSFARQRPAGRPRGHHGAGPGGSGTAGDVGDREDGGATQRTATYAPLLGAG
ncbi:hypothetical protein AB0D37_40875 [Streptomyces sp. NPDC048384]|uniref:hypothetical protein n=1 Tax=Streptomyces sp. NPDC048384 TaxID=3155487 RepID=UPI003445E242